MIDIEAADGFYIQLGDQPLTGPDAFGVVWHVTDWGHWGGAGSSISLTQKSQAPGAWAGNRQYTAKSIPIAGYFVAPDRESAVAALDRLDTVVDLDGQQLLVIETNRLAGRQVMAYRQDEVLPSWESDRVVNWSIQLVAPDPRRLGLSGVLGQAVLSGFTDPLGPNRTVGVIHMTNPGNATGPLTATVHGPVEALSFQVGARRVTLGQTYHTGDVITVDMEAETAVLNGVSQNVTITDRDWFGFTPGDNAIDISYNNGSISAASTVQIIGTPAWK